MLFLEPLQGSPSGYLDLNHLAKRWLQGMDPSLPNPLLNPHTAETVLQQGHRDLGLAWSYGGWQEDRRDLHRDTYLNPDKRWIHIGLDVNAGAGTPIRALASGTIVHVGDDSPLIGGWGGHIVQIICFRGQPYALIYAHLGGIRCCVGNIAKKGDEIARIGTPAENGNWAPHVHLQLLQLPDLANSARDWKKVLDELDGYVRKEDASKWARLCPDPTPLIFGLGE